MIVVVALFPGSRVWAQEPGTEVTIAVGAQLVLMVIKNLLVSCPAQMRLMAWNSLVNKVESLVIIYWVSLLYRLDIGSLQRGHLASRVDEITV